MAEASVTIEVTVHDEVQLWRAALAHMTGSGIDMDDAQSALGTEDAIDVGACLRMLLDPGESPPGCTIEESHANG